MATTFYIESGTGKQITDLNQIDPLKSYVQSGTGQTVSGSALKPASTITPVQSATPAAPQPTSVAPLPGVVYQTGTETPGGGGTDPNTKLYGGTPVPSNATSTSSGLQVPQATTPAPQPQPQPQQQQAQQPAPQAVLPPTTVLQPGSADAANVGRLQDYLVSLGLMNPQDLLNGGRGVYGPKTTAAVAQLQSTLGVDNSTGVGYFGPRTIAALAGKTQSGMGATTGTTTGTEPQAQQTQEMQTAAQSGLTPTQSVQEIYTKMFSESGLGDIKKKFEETLKDQEDLTNKMNEEIADVKNNPWYSQGVAEGHEKRIKEKYQSRLETYSNFAKLYQTMYEDGIEEIRFRAGLAEHDIQRAFESAQKRQEALDKLAEKNIHEVKANGRVMLVDYNTGKVIADLGADNKITTGTNTAPGYNGEFAATVMLAAQAGTTNVQRAQITQNLQNFIANGDWGSAYAQIISSASAKLTGANASNFQQQVQQYNAIAPTRAALQELQAAGYDTNLLTGGVDKIQTKIGALMTDPRYAAIATRLNAAFQQYRQNMTGAAFGQKESAEYASVLPSAGNTFSLNLAKIDGMEQYLNQVVEGTIKATIGQGGNEIKAYAEGAQPAIGQGSGTILVKNGQSFDASDLTPEEYQQALEDGYEPQ